MNDFYFKKENVLEILKQIRKNVVEKKKALEKAFELDYKEWEFKAETEKLIEIIDEVQKQEYLPKFSKEEIIDGIGKIVLVSNSNPYINFNFMLNCLYTNNKVDIILENKLLASNKAIIEVIKKSLKDLKYDTSTIGCIELQKKEEIVSKQDNYDLLYYLGNKDEYISFIKRIHIDTKFENFGEMYVYIDSKDFKDVFLNIDKFAFINEIKVNYYNTNFTKAVSSINKNNNINKISVIFTKNIDKAYEFIKKVKSENVYINIDPTDQFKYNINANNLVYSKKIKIKK